MALRVEGKPIPLVEGVLAGKDLGIAPQLQEQTEWCWATCLKIVLEANGVAGKHQCDFPNAAFSLTGCCLAPSSSMCNSPIPIVQFATEYNRYGFRANYQAGSLSFIALQNELNAGNPIQIGIIWKGGYGAGHALLITGWDQDEGGSLVLWTNSLDNSFNHTHYDDFLTNFAQWEWKWSWTGIKKL